MRVTQATVAHIVPERPRISIPRATRRPRLLEKIRRLAHRIPGVFDVAENASTGSLLVHHRRGSGYEVTKVLAKMAPEADLFSLAVPEFGLVKRVIDIGEKSTRSLAKQSAIANAVVASLNWLNQIVKRITGNIDLKRAILFGVAVFGIVKSIQAGNTFFMDLAAAAIVLDFALELFFASERTTGAREFLALR